MKENYAQRVRRKIINEAKLEGIYKQLGDYYALLAMTVGENCTNKHVHDAWTLWQSHHDSTHRSAIPFEELTKEVQELDTPYRDAIIRVARTLQDK